MNTAADEPLSRTTRILHWSVAIGMLAMIGSGLYAAETPRGPEKTAIIQVHKSLGMIVLVFLLARLLWRLVERLPPPVAPMPALEQALARTVQWLLILLPLVMVASGIVRSLAYARGIDVFGLPVVPAMLQERNIELNEWAAAVHDTTALILFAVIGLHVAGALRHHFIKRDGTLARMIGRPAPSADSGRGIS